MSRQRIGKILCLGVPVMLLLSINNFAHYSEGLQHESKGSKAGQDSQNDKKRKDNKDTQAETDEKVNLSVKVIDKDSPKGIDQAEVTILIEGDSIPSKKTDKDGIAQFSAIKKGKITIRVIATGYKTGHKPGILDQVEKIIEIELKKDTP